MNKTIKMPLWKPKKFLEEEIKITRKGYNVNRLVNVAIIDYFRKFVDQDNKNIPEEFLSLLENVYQEEIIIEHKIYMKVYRYASDVPYSFGDIVSYSLFLYYQKILQE